MRQIFILIWRYIMIYHDTSISSIPHFEKTRTGSTINIWLWGTTPGSSRMTSHQDSVRSMWTTYFLGWVVLTCTDPGLHQFHISSHFITFLIHFYHYQPLSVTINHELTHSLTIIHQRISNGLVPLSHHGMTSSSSRWAVHRSSAISWSAISLLQR